MQGARIAVDPVPLTLFGRQRCQTTVGDRHALGHSRGARRVDHVRDVVRLGPPVTGESTTTHRVHGCTELAVQADPPDTDGKIMRGRLIGQAHDGFAVGDHVFDAFSRITRVHRQESCAGLGDRPHRGHRGGTPLQGDGNDVLGSDLQAEKVTGPTVRPFVEFPVGEHLATVVGQRARTGFRGRPLARVEDERRRVRVAAHGIGEQIGQEGLLVRPCIARLVGSRGDTLGPLVLGQHIEVADGDLGVCDDALEDADEALRHGFDDGCGVFVPRVGQPHHVPGDPELQIETRSRGVDLCDVGDQVAELEGRAGFVGKRQGDPDEGILLAAVVRDSGGQLVIGNVGM